VLKIQVSISPIDKSAIYCYHGRITNQKQKGKLMQEQAPNQAPEVNDQAVAWLQNPDAPGKQIDPAQVAIDTAETAQLEQAQATHDIQQAAQVAPITPEPELTPVAQLQYDQAVVARDMDKDGAEQLKAAMLSNPDNTVKQ
jgi:hypothetical protein